jgi:hypothetical protein
VEESLKEWLERITQPKKELKGFSVCPFAKKAVEENKIYWSYIGTDCESYILNYIDSTPNDFELIAFINLGKGLTDDNLLSIISKLNEKRPDLVFLKDHPDNPGFINGVETGNKKYPLILVQPKDKLSEAREKLKKTKYYDVWDEEYKKEIWSYGYES